MSSLSHLFNAENAITTFGLVGVFTILFIETGLPLVIGLPGDSLLFVAGFAASGSGHKHWNEHIPMLALALGAPIAVILGSQFGYHLGRQLGWRIFRKDKGRFFSKEKMKSAEKWMAKYGHGKAIILGRFIPVVRGLINPLAGMVKVPHGKFTFFNISGALIWTQGLTWAGFVVGEKFQGSIDKMLLPIVAVIVLVTLLPLVWEIFKEWRSRKHFA